MQPITLELSERDLNLLETALGDSRALKVVKDYLATLEASEREEVESVYLNFEKPLLSIEQEARIERHKFNMYTLLVEHGLILEKKKPVKTSKVKSENSIKTRKITKTKIKRLSQYRELTEAIEMLHNRLYSLELELKNYDSVTVTSFNTAKVNVSKPNYNFGNFKISSEIDTVKDIINRKVIEWEEQRNYLNDIFDQIEDIKVQQMFHYRYINGYTWDEISSEVNKSKPWCEKKHSEYIRTLQL